MKYSIKDLERLSGIKAHSLRIWEKRYKIFSPQRSLTNIRSYSDVDLRKLLNIAILNRNGLKISKIALMTSTVLEQEVIKLHKYSNDVESVIDRMTVTLLDLNELEFNRVITDLLFDIDFEELVMDYLFVFLERIGVLWQTGSISPAQEHFISNIIRSKLIVAIEKIPVPVVYKSQKFLLFLREGELHEFGLLFINYLLRKYEFRTIYLGQSVPYADILSIQKEHKADFLITTIINQTGVEDSDITYFNRLNIDINHGRILGIGKPFFSDISKFKKVVFIESYKTFREFIREL